MKILGLMMVMVTGVLATGSLHAQNASPGVEQGDDSAMSEAQVRKLKSYLEVKMRKKKIDKTIDSSWEGILQTKEQYVYVVSIANRGSEPVSGLVMNEITLLEKAPLVGANRKKEPKIVQQRESSPIPALGPRESTELTTLPALVNSARVRSGYAWDEGGVSNISNDDLLGCVIRIASGETLILEVSNPTSLGPKLDAIEKDAGKQKPAGS